MTDSRHSILNQLEKRNKLKGVTSSLIEQSLSNSWQNIDANDLLLSMNSNNNLGILSSTDSSEEDNISVTNILPNNSSINPNMSNNNQTIISLSPTPKVAMLNNKSDIERSPISKEANLNTSNLEDTIIDTSINESFLEISKEGVEESTSKLLNDQDIDLTSLTKSMSSSTNSFIMPKLSFTKTNKNNNNSNPPIQSKTPSKLQNLKHHNKNKQIHNHISINNNFKILIIGETISKFFKVIPSSYKHLFEISSSLSNEKNYNGFIVIIKNVETFEKKILKKILNFDIINDSNYSKQIIPICHKKNQIDKIKKILNPYVKNKSISLLYQPLLISNKNDLHDMFKFLNEASKDDTTYLQNSNNNIIITDFLDKQDFTDKGMYPILNGYHQTTIKNHLKSNSKYTYLVEPLTYYSKYFFKNFRTIIYWTVSISVGVGIGFCISYFASNLCSSVSNGLRILNLTTPIFAKNKTIATTNAIANSNISLWPTKFSLDSFGSNVTGTDNDFLPVVSEDYVGSSLPTANADADDSSIPVLYNNNIITGSHIEKFTTKIKDVIHKPLILLKKTMNCLNDFLKRKPKDENNETGLVTYEDVELNDNNDYPPFSFYDPTVILTLGYILL